MVTLTKNSRIVLERRYLRKDSNGQLIETPEGLFERVATNIASAGRFYGESEKEINQTKNKFYDMMESFEFLPNSPTLMNAGRELQQLSACFVLPVGDSMESIFESIKNTALIHKSGGGTGFSFSQLRPKDDRVLTTGGIASGPISFMRVFNSATEAVKQGGTRRGANMGILRVDHPDILEFITVKKDNSELTNFNISVALTEKFMQAVIEDKEYSLINPRTKQEVKKLPAQKVFNLIVESAWASGEPGIIFIDRINKDNPTPAIGEIESTNPCGEQPLLPYESCNLGSINLAQMTILEGIKYKKINYKKLEETIKWAVKFLDNVIDMNKYPLPQIEHITKANRKIGLGVMGFADMLIQMGIAYNSEKAINTAEEVFKFIHAKAKEYSCELAEKRGPFPNYDKSIYKEQNLRLRNSTLTTIAPTGTISIIAGASSGIEPIFAVCYERNVMDNDTLVEVNPYFEEVARREEFYSKDLFKKIAETGTIQNFSEIPQEVKDIFVTAHDITPQWHLKIQAAFQKWTDNAVSKTVNFPHNATIEDVRQAYLLAYKLDCKGVTIYRDGSRDAQVLTTKKKQKTTEKISPVDINIKIIPRERHSTTIGITEKVGTGCGNLYITVNEDDKGLCELFSQMGKAGGCAASQLEATSRLISLALRSGVEPEAIISQLKGIRCPAPYWASGGVILSCADAIAKVLEHRVNNGNISILKGEISDSIKKSNETKQLAKVNNIVGVCPDCSGPLNYEEGCMICKSCGYSKCG